jgi:NTE family protein
MAYHFRNLIFEGGGVKGIAYVGALRELERVLGPNYLKKKIMRVGGTSAGAINATLFALRYSTDEMRDILWKLDFNNFLDDSWGIIRDTERLLEEFGWYKGDFFRAWMGELIRKKTKNEHSTFNDLRKMGYPDLFLIGTNLSTGFGEVFSVEHTPRMCVVDAVRVSMSIPLFFAAIRNPRNDVYVDGGVFTNYPVKLFDREKYLAPAAPKRHSRLTDYYKEENKKIPKTSSPYIFNKETLGFRLDSEEEISMFRDGAEPPHEKIDRFFSYAWALVKAIMNAQNNVHLHSDDWQRTVYIDTIGVGTTDFDLSEKKKRRLIAEGRKGVREYFKWYNKKRVDPKALPLNHPNSP